MTSRKPRHRRILQPDLTGGPMKRRILTTLLAPMVFAALWMACSDDARITPPAADPSPAPAFDWAVGPIDGLTTVWHPAPEALAVPIGTTVRIRCLAPPGAVVKWTNAEEVTRDAAGSIAACVVDSDDRYEVQVRIELPADGRDPKGNPQTTSATHTCIITGIDIDIGDVRITGVQVTATPFDLGENPTNEQTMQAFFSGGERFQVVSRLRNVAEGHFRTAVKRRLKMTAQVEPPELAALIEWRIGDKRPSLGENVTHRFDKTGVHPLSVGPVANPVTLHVETYRVNITSHTSGEDAIHEGVPVTFTAVTEPPGYEDDVTWLASTKYGTALPVTGQGRTFTVRFDDTWGPHPDDPTTIFQWLGVRADNAVFNQDQKNCSVFILRCLDVCRGATVSFGSFGQPLGGSYTWAVTAGAGNVDPDSGTGDTFPITAEQNGTVTLRVTYTVDGKQCEADCTFDVVDCEPCNCYFNSDCTTFGLGDMCNSGQQIDWQGRCRWMKPKFFDNPPSCDHTPGNPVADCCSEETNVFGDCDGRCESALLGSFCGTQDAARLSAAAYLWGEACITVAETGGGRIDDVLVMQASDLLSAPCATIIGRHVGDVLFGVAGYDFFEHPQGVHDFEEHHVADLSRNPALVLALRKLIEALVAEIEMPGAGDAIVGTIPAVYPGFAQSAVSCPGRDVLECMRLRNQNLAIYLTTERVEEP